MFPTLRLIRFTGTGLSLSHHVAFRIADGSDINTLPTFTLGMLYARLLDHPAVKVVSMRSTEVVAQLVNEPGDEPSGRVLEELSAIVWRTLARSDAGIPCDQSYRVEIEAVRRQVYVLGVYGLTNGVSFSLGMLDLDFDIRGAFMAGAGAAASHYEISNSWNNKTCMDVRILPHTPADTREFLIDVMIGVVEARFSGNGVGSDGALIPSAFIVGPLAPRWVEPEMPMDVVSSK